MRHILMLSLFFTCLSAASAANDPITKVNNDASLRETQWWGPGDLARGNDHSVVQ